MGSQVDASEYLHAYMYIYRYVHTSCYKQFRILSDVIKCLKYNLKPSELL